jgi:hypothetical protein
MSELETLLTKSAVAHSVFTVSLGSSLLRVVSNSPTFAGSRFFARRAFLDTEAPVDFELWCIDDPGGAIRRAAGGYPPDTSYRARSFAIGYFATDHFGEPVLFHRSGQRYFIVGTALERPFWTFFVKAFIFYKSLEKEQLFLKAAAVEIAGRGVLIAGRGTGGKTTLVQTLCRHGARFVTNSHAIVSDCDVIGVASSMRVRKTDVAAGAGLGFPALRVNEGLVDPFELFQGAGPGPLPLQHILIVDYRPDRDEGVRHLAPDEAFCFLDQFALGVNVYRLEEEMLEYCGGDVFRFGREGAALRQRLLNLTQNVPCFVVQTDVHDSGKRAHLLEFLAVS